MESVGELVTGGMPKDVSLMMSELSKPEAVATSAGTECRKCMVL